MARFFDYILGQGKYGDDQPANPATGYTPGDQRSAFFTSLANTVGALVEAQNLSGADRANMMASIPARLQSGQEGLRLMTEQRRADTSRSEMDAFADTLSPEQRMLFKIDPAGYAKMRMTPPPALSGSPGSYAAYVKDQDSRGLPAMSYVEFVTDQNRAGATSVNVATSREKDQNAAVVDYYKAMMGQRGEAANTLTYINDLDRELKNIGGSQFENYLKSFLPASMSGLGAYVALRNKLAPMMKAGPGSTSDKDIEFMLNSLPNITYSAEKNKVIIDAFRKKAKMQLELADVARAFNFRRIDMDEADRREAAVIQQYTLTAEEAAAFRTPQAALKDAVESNQG